MNHRTRDVTNADLLNQLTDSNDPGIVGNLLKRSFTMQIRYGDNDNLFEFFFQRYFDHLNRPSCSKVVIWREKNIIRMDPFLICYTANPIIRT